MARAGILYSDVVRAAEKISQSGVAPTVDKVRAMLGDTGSKSTIAPMLKQWKDAHSSDAAAIKSGLPESILNAVRAVYELIQAESDNAISQTKAECDQQLAEKNNQLSTLTKKVTLLEETQRALQEQLSREQTSNQSLNKQLNECKTSLSTLESEKLGLTSRLIDNEKQLDALHHQLTSSRQQFEHFQAASAEQRNDDRRLYEAKITRLESELRQMHAINATTQTETAQLKAEILRLETTQSKMKEFAQIQLNELSSLDANYNKTTFKLEDAERRNGLLSEQLRETTQRLQDASIQIALLSKNQTLLEQQITELQEKDASDEQAKLHLIARILEKHEANASRASENLKEDQGK
ncbi:DNA-binding protein [Undibacterium sp. MH2W]